MAAGTPTPGASVKPVGAKPHLLTLPSADVASVVPVPEVVPPADSTVRLIELSIVPVTVRVPLEVAAAAPPAIAISAANATMVFFMSYSLELRLARGALLRHVLSPGVRRTAGEMK